MEDWIHRLKAGYDAGYYRTETDRADQIAFPWQDKHCGDCPFWANGLCRVEGTLRSVSADTCTYFDSVHHAEARVLITERVHESRRKLWGWTDGTSRL